MKSDPTMREITIKSSTSSNRRRRNLWMTEIINEKSLVARAEKRYSYFVTESNEPVTKDNLHAWMESKAQIARKKPRHTFVRRCFDRETGIGQTLFRTTGSFYVVKKYKIYAVVFLHSIKFDVLSSTEAPFE